MNTVRFFAVLCVAVHTTPSTASEESPHPWLLMDSLEALEGRLAALRKQHLEDKHTIQALDQQAKTDKGRTEILGEQVNITSSNTRGLTVALHALTTQAQAPQSLSSDTKKLEEILAQQESIAKSIQSLIAKNFTLQQKVRSAHKQIATLEAHQQQLQDQLQQSRVQPQVMLDSHIAQLNAQLQAAHDRQTDFEQELGRIKAASHVSSAGSPHVDLRKYARKLEEFIEEPEDSFDGLDETLTDYQKHIRDLVIARSNRATEPRELSGILLSGPPGTGKTRFAGALAREANLPFCHLGASFFNEGFGGEGSSLVRSLFLLAQKYSEGRNGKNPGILIFIDEIDILAKKRNSSNTGGFITNVETTAASLWKTLDKIKRTQKRTVVIAATNKPENCDHAILGRFYKYITFEPATIAQLFTALNYHLRKKSGYRNPTGITLDLRSSQAPLSFRSIKNLVDEACDYADADQTRTLTQEHFNKALKNIIELELRKSKPSEDEERRQREIESHEWHKRSLKLQTDSHALQFVSLDSNKRSEYVRDYVGIDEKPSSCPIM